MKIIVVTPVYNDWESFSFLIKDLREQCAKNSVHLEIIAVNDASTYEPDISHSDIPVTLLNLTINIGHQRAISIGLSYIHENCIDYDYVIVMDSDGEDKPKDIITLLKITSSFHDQKIIFAARKKRYETGLFKIFYFFYKTLFYILTGKSIHFGNFSCIPKRLLIKVISNPELWNHYSGSIIKSGIGYDMTYFDRGKRYFGKSKMSLVKLILHGFSSISVYLDRVSVHLLLFSITVIGIAICSVLTVIGLKIFTELAIPGWASNISLLILNIVIQFSLITLLILLLILHNRNSFQAPPGKFYKDYIDSVTLIPCRDNSAISEKFEQ